MNKNKLLTMPVKKLVLDMSFPMMLSLLIQALYNIVDSIFVARLSEQALTATSFAYPIQMLMISVGVGTAVGLNAVLSRNLGAKKYKEANEIASTGVVLAILCSLVFSAAGLLGSGAIARLLAKEGEVVSLCRQYLSICMIFSLGNMLCMTYQRLMQATGKTLLSMVILLSGAVTNIVLDPLMIFGFGSFPGLGITGAAIATVIGQWVSMITGLILQKKYNKEVIVKLIGFHWNWKYVREIYKVGAPTILTQAMQSMLVTGVNTILRLFSGGAVAFFGVYYKLQMFLFMPVNGLGQAAIPIVGFNYGAGKKDRIRESMKMVYALAVIISFCGSILFIACPSKLLGLFSASEEMLNIGIPAIRIMAPTYILASISMISGYISSGLQDGMTNMIVSFLRQFIPLLPLAWFLGNHWGIDAIWYAFWISELCGLIWAIFRIRKKCIKQMR